MDRRHVDRARDPPLLLERFELHAPAPPCHLRPSPHIQASTLSTTTIASVASAGAQKAPNARRALIISTARGAEARRSCPSRSRSIACSRALRRFATLRIAACAARIVRSSGIAGAPHPVARTESSRPYPFGARRDCCPSASPRRYCSSKSLCLARIDSSSQLPIDSPHSIHSRPLMRLIPGSESPGSHQRRNGPTSSGTLREPPRDR